MTTPLNPLLTFSQLPAFKNIHPADIKPAVESVLNQNRIEIEKILQKDPQWELIVAPLEDLDNQLSLVWSIANHLNHVISNEQFREATHNCLPLLSDYHLELSQNERLYALYHQISQNKNFSSLSATQQKMVTDTLRDFRLSGVHLPEADKKRFADLSKRLTQLCHHFEENVIDATDAWHLLITDENKLQGLSDDFKQRAAEKAKAHGDDGWWITLDYPAYYAVMTYADNRELRKAVYKAYNTRASDQSETANKFDNSQLMVEILATRKELAELLGFHNYAEYSIEPKMADSTKQVLDFIENLITKVRAAAKKDFEELTKFAKTLGEGELFAWDLSYFSEKMRQHKFNISQEKLKEYFPVDHVLSAMFSIAEQLYSIKIQQKPFEQAWHESVRFYEVYDKNDQLISYLFLDLFARSQKQGGAWMDACRDRHINLQKVLFKPVVMLTCNFTPPLENKTPLLNFDEVTTIFHEFGHGLHHLLTQINHHSISGTNGVEWDAIELPSLFNEHFCWEPICLKLISKHYQTSEKLPDELIKQLIDSKNFMKGMALARQLEFTLFDFRLHMEFDPTQEGVKQIQTILNEVRQKTAVITPPDFNRFQHAFTHIFGGGYAAGYYSYLWAEVLASDAFERFKTEGVISRKVGEEFWQKILSVGGSRKALQSFIDFMGREPKIDALLASYGLT